MADNFLSGKQGQVEIASTTYSFRSWKAPMEIANPDITNFTSGGFQAILNAITKATITLEGPYNEGNMAFTVGNSYTFVLGYTNSISLTVTAIVGKITPTVDVHKEQIVEIGRASCR